MYVKITAKHGTKYFVAGIKLTITRGLFVPFFFEDLDVLPFD